MPIQGIVRILGMSVFHLRDCVLRRAAFRPANLKRPPLSKYLPELGDYNITGIIWYNDYRGFGKKHGSILKIHYHCSFS